MSSATSLVMFTSYLASFFYTTHGVVSKTTLKSNPNLKNPNFHDNSSSSAVMIMIGVNNVRCCEYRIL